MVISFPNHELTGVFEANCIDEPGAYPSETEYVKIEYDQDGYYDVYCLDENKSVIGDPNLPHGNRAEHRIEGALNSDPRGKYNILVGSSND